MGTGFLTVQLLKNIHYKQDSKHNKDEENFKKSNKFYVQKIMKITEHCFYWMNK